MIIMPSALRHVAVCAAYSVASPTSVALPKDAQYQTPTMFPGY